MSEGEKKKDFEILKRTGKYDLTMMDEVMRKEKKKDQSCCREEEVEEDALSAVLYAGLCVSLCTLLRTPVVQRVKYPHTRALLTAFDWAFLIGPWDYVTLHSTRSPCPILVFDLMQGYKSILAI